MLKKRCTLLVNINIQFWHSNLDYVRKRLLDITMSLQIYICRSIKLSASPNMLPQLHICSWQAWLITSHITSSTVGSLAGSWTTWWGAFDFWTILWSADWYKAIEHCICTWHWIEIETINAVSTYSLIVLFWDGLFLQNFFKYAGYHEIHTFFRAFDVIYVFIFYGVWLSTFSTLDMKLARQRFNAAMWGKNLVVLVRFAR